MHLIDPGFFNKSPLNLAVALLGKVLRRQVITCQGPQWLAARIIETEAYDINEKGSHSSLGFTEKRRAMFMPPGTIYMYYARGGDSLNFSARGRGNGVLIKSAHPYIDAISPTDSLAVMQRLNPGSQGPRPIERLCNGQTLLCRSLDLKVPDWNQAQLDAAAFRLEDVGSPAPDYVQCPRLGIPPGRDHHLPYRFVSLEDAALATSNPLRKRAWQEGVDYVVHRRGNHRNRR